MNSKKTVLNTIVIIVILLIGISSYKSFKLYTDESEIVAEYDLKVVELNNIYSDIFSELKEDSKFDIKNDSTFKSIVNEIIIGNYKSEEDFFYWIQSNNISVNFLDASTTYKKLYKIVSDNKSKILAVDYVIHNLIDTYNNNIEIGSGKVINSVLFGFEQIQCPTNHLELLNTKEDEIVDETLEIGYKNK